jgi:hypothetical protein
LDRPELEEVDGILNVYLKQFLRCGEVPAFFLSVLLQIKWKARVSGMDNSPPSSTRNIRKGLGYLGGVFLFVDQPE